MNSLAKFFIAPVAVVPVATGPASAVELSDAEIKNIARRSYPYIAMYNVDNKFAQKQGAWNTVDADTKLKDHTMREIARPNNDTLYIGCMLDLRKDPVILEMLAFDSKYVSLMVTDYDHYVNVPMATRRGDFKNPERILCGCRWKRDRGEINAPPEKPQSLGMPMNHDTPSRACRRIPRPARAESESGKSHWKPGRRR